MQDYNYARLQLFNLRNMHECNRIIYREILKGQTCERAELICRLINFCVAKISFNFQQTPKVRDVYI